MDRLGCVARKEREMRLHASHAIHSTLWGSEKNVRHFLDLARPCMRNSLQEQEDFACMSGRVIWRVVIPFFKMFFFSSSQALIDLTITEINHYVEHSRCQPPTTLFTSVILKVIGPKRPPYILGYLFLLLGWEWQPQVVKYWCRDPLIGCNIGLSSFAGDAAPLWFHRESPQLRCCFPMSYIKLVNCHHVSR